MAAVAEFSAVTDSEEGFRQQAEKIHDQLLRYHQLFDIYNEYPGLNNLKTVNDHAGMGPVQVDGASPGAGRGEGRVHCLP